MEIITVFNLYMIVSVICVYILPKDWFSVICVYEFHDVCTRGINTKTISLDHGYANLKPSNKYYGLHANDLYNIWK